MKISIMHRSLQSVLLLFLATSPVAAQQAGDSAEREELGHRLAGSWLINDELSDNRDDQVEEAIKEGGGKVQRRLFSRRPEDFYRGGPPEQELYDRISYDDVLTIEYAAPEFVFTYADDYKRIFHTDGRRRRTTANSFYEQGGEDFSFGNWDAGALVVEARPRDGGFTLETYRLEEVGERLVVEMFVEPDSFRAAINLRRVYDRAD